MGILSCLTTTSGLSCYRFLSRKKSYQFFFQFEHFKTFFIFIDNSNPEKCNISENAEILYCPKLSQASSIPDDESSCFFNFLSHVSVINISSRGAESETIKLCLCSGIYREDKYMTHYAYCANNPWT